MAEVEFEQRVLTSTHVLSVHGRVAIAAWTAPPVVEDVRGIHAALTTLAARYPSGVAALMHFREAYPVSPPAREEVVRIMRDVEALRGAAVVYSKDGFGAAALRAIISGLSLLQRSGAPQRVVKTGEEAARWLLEVLPKEPPVTVVSELVQAFDRTTSFLA